MVSVQSKTLTASKAASETLGDNLEAVRLQIEKARDQREAIEQRPVAKDEAIDRLSTWSDRLRKEAFSRISPTRFAAPRYREPIVSDTLDLLLGVAATMMRDELARQIGDLYQADAGLTGAQRTAALAEADRGLLDLELQEESLIRSAERAGFDVMRRANADPRAVLASDEVLP